MYYYNFNNISIYKTENKKFIKYKNDIYIFESVINRDEILEAYNILKSENKYYKIMLNKDQSIFTPYNGVDHILMKTTNVKENIFNILLEEKKLDVPSKFLNRTDWSFLWSNKIDYYEYQINHIKGKYPIIDESIEYFIGLAETALSYYEYNCKNINKNVTICHRRIYNNGYFNPLNVIIDYKERDIGEFLKYLFWHHADRCKDIDKIIEMLISSNKNMSLVYSRMIYPSFYFDIYDDIVNSRERPEKMLKIINRISEYEEYLNYVQLKIREKIEIQEISWIKK